MHLNTNRCNTETINIGEVIHTSKTLSQDEFVERLSAINPDINVLGSYVETRLPVLVECRKCGFIWKARANNLLYRKSGCPECKKETLSRLHRKSREVFINELAEIAPEICALEDYGGDGSRLLVKCQICGHEWKATPNHLLQGHGCPKCSRTSTSFMEQFLYHAMVRAFGEERVKNRDKTLINSELDIVVERDNDIVAIEIGSWRFHRNSIERDMEKIEQCGDKGIKLWAIFDQYEGKEPPYDCNCFVYGFGLGAEPEHKTLKRITGKLLSDLGQKDLSTDEYKEIEALAIESSKRTTTEDFKKEIKELLPSVTVLGEYVRSNRGIKCKCKECGTVWYPTPANLRQGHGCRFCANRENGLLRRQSKEEYEAKLKALNPHLSLVGDYDGSQNPIKVHCSRHDITWIAPNAHTLTSRSNCGCKKCKSEAISKRWRKPHDQYVQELADKNPKIEVLGEYEGNSKKIKVRCLTCQHIWDPVAGDLLQGRDCPACWERRRGASRRWTQERFDEELKEAHPNIVRLTDYEGANRRIKVKCLVCGTVWDSKANYLVTRSRGCPNREKH